MVLAKLRPLPFQYRWSVWHSKPDSQDEYLLRPLVEDVADIGAFYRIFNNVPWNEIRPKDSIHIFLAGVKPLWEDAENQNGGRWLIRVRPENNRAIRVWEEVCILCCGGELQAALAQGNLQVETVSTSSALIMAEHDHILGMSFSPRLSSVHISIWTKQGDNMRSIMLLERAIIDGLSPELRPGSNADFNFRRHFDKMNSHLHSRHDQLPRLLLPGFIARPLPV